MAEMKVGDRHSDVFASSDIELHDKATPLPAFPDVVRTAGAGDDDNGVVLRSPVCDVGGVTVTTRRCAKDKRNLREKRRSTGRVSYSDTSDGQPSGVNDDDAEVDHETDRNTSYNETPATSTTTSGTTSHSAVSRCPTTSTDGQSAGTSPPNRCGDAAPAVRPLTKTAPPALPPKPKVCCQPAGTGRSAPQPRPFSDSASTTEAPDDHTTLLARVNALEKVVHEANAENLRLKEMLLMRENRIAELETEVEALNKDLDIADEDYEKLEEKNGALVRVVAQLSRH